MARIYLAEIAEEESTFAIGMQVVDNLGAPVIPTTATWTLTNSAGAIINSREDVAISIPAADMTVALSGDDLALSAGEDTPVPRCFTFKGTYTSSLGSGLPLNQEVWFYIENLVAVP